MFNSLSSDKDIGNGYPLSKDVLLTSTVQMVVKTQDELVEALDILKELGVGYIVYSLRGPKVWAGGDYEGAVRWLEKHQP